jgi:hypothetical protein
MDKLKELMRRCKCGVYVTVNLHRDNYETAEQALTDRIDGRVVEAAIRAKMIETDTIIEVQFYPETPISFYWVMHYDLDAALDHALACIEATP